MARKTILDVYYTFTPSTRTIVIPRAIPRERLVLITNVTTNQVLYNFSDSTLKATSYVIATDTSGNTTTTIVLNYNTTALTSTDKLQIIIDEYDEKFSPSESYTDPVNKIRVSEGQALIDTDFEYGTQNTKWESLSMINNRPFAYYNLYNQLLATDVQVVNGSRTVTVTVTSGAPAAGSAIYMQDTTWAGADGLYIVDTSNGTTSFTYTARIQFTGTTGSIFNTGVTSAYQGSIFTGAAISLTSITNSGLAVTVTTSVPHGLALGNEIALTGTSASTNAPNGSWIVNTITSPTVFVFYVTAAPTGSITGGSLYVRPQGQALHRAFDGGVKFSTNAASHNQQLIRQTRRYFRYQSGKGIQVSTGSILKPNINVDQLSAAGTTITVVTKDQHNINPGLSVIVSGCNETAYNGTFVVVSVLDPYRFTYTALTTPSATPASGPYVLSISSWYGNSNRLGIFDNQNGIFFEFDGQTLYACRRSSTYQISGVVSVSANSSTVSGVTTNGVTTLFSKQLAINDFIVIKGMSYRVINIASDTSLTINPPYRGSINLTNAVVSKTVDLKIAQSTWNIDRCDGTGPSGYNIDLTKMQMFYMDFSWYGAGFIRWGFRGPDGNVIYCHKLINNNVNYEAYMRSGNLPARYESNTFSRTTQLTATANSGDTSISVTDTTGFPTAGTALIRNGSQQEYVNFTGKTGTTLTGLTRGQAGGSLTLVTTSGSPILTGASTTGVQVGQYLQGTGVPPNAFVTSFVANTSVTMSQAATASGSQTIVFPPMGQTAQTFTYSATAPTAVEMHALSYASQISHWGTSVIMDGRYDDDKSFVFVKGMTTTLAINSGTNNALMSIRVAPSVSNGVTGLTLGVRELANRMQLVLRQTDMFSNGNFLITMVLNGTVSSATPNWQSVGGSSLAQYIFHSSGTTILGGETIFGFFLNTSGSTSTYSVTQQDLTQVKDMGTSILSGGVAAGNVGVFPDGPDIITVVAQNIGSSTANLFGRLSWTEAQA